MGVSPRKLALRVKPLAGLESLSDLDGGTELPRHRLNASVVRFVRLAFQLRGRCSAVSRCGGSSARPTDARTTINNKQSTLADSENRGHPDAVENCLIMNRAPIENGDSSNST